MKRRLKDLVEPIDPTHEDDRRTITEWVNGKEEFRNAVVIETNPYGKKALVLGNHYHAKKTETFLLLSGKITRLLLADTESDEKEDIMIIDPLARIFMPPGIAHQFTIIPGSVLLCVSSHPYDRSDDRAWNDFDL